MIEFSQNLTLYSKICDNTIILEVAQIHTYWHDIVQGELKTTKSEKLVLTYQSLYTCTVEPGASLTLVEV